jgi:hypothetical protein
LRNTFVNYPAVQLDSNRVPNNLTEKGGGVFAFSLTEITVLHVVLELLGITRFAEGWLELRLV